MSLLMSCVGLTLSFLPRFTQTIKILQSLTSLCSPPLYPSSHHQISKTMPSHDVTQEIKLLLMDSIYKCLLYPSCSQYLQITFFSVYDILSIFSKTQTFTAINNILHRSWTISKTMKDRFVILILICCFSVIVVL